MTTAQELLNAPDPTNDQLERVDALWEQFSSTTQFLKALQMVLINREPLDYEVNALAKFLPTMAQAEANGDNVSLADLAKAEPITQRY